MGLVERISLAMEVPLGAFRAWVTAAVVIVMWGITFVNTRALLTDFSALEILVVRLG